MNQVNPICIAREDYNLLLLTPKDLLNPEHCFFIRPSPIIYSILNFCEILPPFLSHISSVICFSLAKLDVFKLNNVTNLLEYLIWFMSFSLKDLCHNICDTGYVLKILSSEKWHIFLNSVKSVRNEISPIMWNSSLVVQNQCRLCCLFVCDLEISEYFLV